MHARDVEPVVINLIVEVVLEGQAQQDVDHVDLPNVLLVAHIQSEDSAHRDMTLNGGLGYDGGRSRSGRSSSSLLCDIKDKANDVEHLAHKEKALMAGQLGGLGGVHELCEDKINGIDHVGLDVIA